MATHRKGTQRTVPPVQPGSPEGRDIGLSDRMLGTPSPIPGGATHVTNAPTVHQKVSAPVARPPFRGQMAHGVPPEQWGHERGALEHGTNGTRDPKPRFTGPADQTPPERPVPVVIVDEGADSNPLTTSSTRRYVIPTFSNEPVRLVGRNPHRVQLLLINEHAATHIRLGHRQADLVTQHSGAILPAAASSYTRLCTQDELYAISDDSATAPTISIIEEFRRPNAQVQG